MRIQTFKRSSNGNKMISKEESIILLNPFYFLVRLKIIKDINEYCFVEEEEDDKKEEEETTNEML